MQKEAYLYGSSRLGVRLLDRDPTEVLLDSQLPAKRQYTRSHYELSNHLGNVLATVTGRKLGIDINNNGSGVDYYKSEIVQASDYYPFGSEMPKRTYRNMVFDGTNEYRYGFNGKELDKSNEFGDLTHYDYGFRIYNPSIGKFLSVDPLTKSYPELTPYQFAHNRPIEFIDIDGLEGISINDKDGNQRENTSYGNTSDLLLKGSIDKISQNDGVSICDIQLTDVGPQEFLDKSSPITGGVSKSVFHEYTYTYQGVDADGNSVNGSGTVLQPVARIKVGSSLIDAAIGGFLSWGFAKVGNIKLSNVVTVVDDVTPRVVNSKGVEYPKVVVKGFGEVPFPLGQVSKVTPSPPDLRAAFNKIRDSGEFRAWWESQGRSWPTPSSGSRIDIHHIKPLGHGGTNEFNNLVPLDYITQHKLFNSWWLKY